MDAIVALFCLLLLVLMALGNEELWHWVRSRWFERLGRRGFAPGDSAALRACATAWEPETTVHRVVSREYGDFIVEVGLHEEKYKRMRLDETEYEAWGAAGALVRVTGARLVLLDFVSPVLAGRRLGLPHLDDRPLSATLPGLVAARWRGGPGALMLLARFEDEVRLRQLARARRSRLSGLGLGGRRFYEAAIALALAAAEALAADRLVPARGRPEFRPPGASGPSCCPACAASLPGGARCLECGVPAVPEEWMEPPRRLVPVSSERFGLLTRPESDDEFGELLEVLAAHRIPVVVFDDARAAYVLEKDLDHARYLAGVDRSA